MQKFFADSLKFSVKFNADGTLVSSWNADDGKEQTRSGTWEQLEGDGLRWRLAIKLAQPQADAMEVWLISRSERGAAASRTCMACAPSRHASAQSASASMAGGSSAGASVSAARPAAVRLYHARPC